MFAKETGVGYRRRHLEGPMRQIVQFVASLVLLIGLVVAPFNVALGSEEPATVDELVVEIQKTYGDVQSVRADFTQVSRTATGEHKTKGKVSLKRPRLMKWDSTKEPGGTLFVTNGEKMWIYSPTDEQVLVYSDLSGAGGGAPFDLLDSLENLTEHFDVKLESSEGGKERKSFVVSLTPKKDDGQYKHIRLVLSKRKYEIESITLTDAFGGETEFVFTKVQMNGDIPDSEFDFAAPEGAEVIEADSI